LIRNALILAMSISMLGCAAHADEFPARKPGLWEITTTQKGSPPDVARLCIDVATEAELLKNAKSTMATICSRHDIRVSGNIATDDSVCRPMSSEQTSHAVTTFNGDAAYTTVTTSHYKPAIYGQGRHEHDAGREVDGPLWARYAAGRYDHARAEAAYRRQALRASMRPNAE